MIKDNLTRMKRSLGVAAATMFALVGVLAFAPAAFADSPAWRLSSTLVPSHLAPGSQGQIILMLTNLGDEKAVASSSEPVKLSVQLPAGLTATEMSVDLAQELFGHVEMGPSCELATLTCTAEGGAVYPYSTLMVTLDVSAAANAGSGSVKLTASGGGASPVSAVEPLSIGPEPVKFGVDRLEQLPLNGDGSFDTQAGSHPFQFVTTLQLNSDFEKGASFLTEGPSQPAMPKELRFNLPPGLVGNPSALPQCPLSKFQPVNNPGGLSECPSNTVIGVASVMLSLEGTPLGEQITQPFDVVGPLYNLTPSVGEPARFGFVVIPGTGSNVPVYLDASVRTGGDYGVTVSVHNISQEIPFFASQVTFWGVPANSRHDTSRGECLGPQQRETGCSLPGQQDVTPFLTLPTSCTGASNPFTTNVEAASWQEPSVFTPGSQGEYRLNDGAGHLFGMDGCNRLAFEPSINVTPDGQQAGTPTGLTVGVHVAQQASLNPNGLADSTVKDTTVTLPAGLALNAAAADGLESCSEAQAALSADVAASCPDASKVGTVEINSPLLPNALTGGAYLAAQNQNPFGSLVALYIVAQDPVSGTLIKLAGEVTLDQATGQLVSTFDNTPQLPFENLRLHFYGGERAPLSTPPRCGTYTTEAKFTPWSGNEPVNTTSVFKVTSGPNGSACPGASLPFSPSLAAGSPNINAGAFSPLDTTIDREDGNQDIQQVTLHMAPGMSGILAGVPLCPEAQANAGTCSQASLIGTTVVSVGLGNDPYSVTGGQVFLTEKYQGAPFGLSIVNPANAGPFHLGNVIVRAKIEINPTTAALTIKTGEIPHIIDGIPLQIKHVNVTIDRPGFTFNPTNCNPMSITGTIGSVEGGSSPVQVPFQVTNCAALKFAPKFQVSTSGKTSKAKGASLTVKLSYPAGSQGTEANIARVKVELPKQLPSQLKTLQKACLASVFEANPAGCPAESIVGHATVHTPLLPVPLEGPAYFVSHGGEEFPDLTLVLQGYGVTVQLVGSTFISKAGITSSTFKATPDVPFNAFELTLPQGKYAALTTYSHATAGGSLCGQSLMMPTEFRAQNGAEIHQNTPITVTGCPAAITVVRQGVKGKTATIQVRVPGAGMLVATAKGLSKASKTAKGATILTLKLTLTNAEAAFLGKHRGRKLKATVNLQFTPKKGGKLKTSTTVILG
jgi:hypothetical protein